MRRRGSSWVLVAAVALLADCGGKTGPGGTTAQTGARATPPATSTPSTPSVPPPSAAPPKAARLPGVPARVPTSGDMAADPAQAAVVKRWAAALQGGHLLRAADAFADGAVVTNGTPPLHLKNRRERLAFNLTFPCGADVVRVRSAKGYLLVTYQLTDRVGSKCDGAGNRALGAVKVTGTKMTEWYRLGDPPQSSAGAAGPVV